MRKKTTAEFIVDATAVHGKMFDYSMVNYINNSTNVQIGCSLHGAFQQTPANHTLRKQGCPKCGLEHLSATHRLPITEFIQRSNIVHMNKYDYSKVLYVNAKQKVNIICPIHGEFKQDAGAHIIGHGCKKCNPCGFNWNKPAILYFFKIDDVYKVGVTNGTVKSRYNSKDYMRMSNILTWKYNTGSEAYDREQYLINHYKEYKYDGPTPFNNTGITECFTTNIYKLHGELNE